MVILSPARPSARKMEGLKGSTSPPEFATATVGGVCKSQGQRDPVHSGSAVVFFTSSMTA